MPLTANHPIAFIPTHNATAARKFYEQTLGLTFLCDDDFALEFEIGPPLDGGPGSSILRIVRSGTYIPAPSTIFGWEVEDIHAAIADLSTRGVHFLRFSFFEQDLDGVWTAPSGATVAWFKDPDGNTLSLSHHPF